jgi:HPt (histidine-containing phosphotransfer) domain-containing protein
MSGDLEKAMDAGMNAHIGKPINVREMFSTMGKWITPSGLHSESEVAILPSVTDGEETPLPDLPYIDVDIGLSRVGGNNKLYKKLLLKFYSSYQNAPAELDQLLERGANEDAERLAHTIKGLAGNVGATELNAKAGELENTIHESKDSEYINLLNEFKKSLDQVMTSLSEIADQEVKTESVKVKKQTLDMTIVEPLMKELIELIEDDDTDAIQTLEKLKENLGGEPVDEKLERLEELVGEYDFEEALDIAKEIMNTINTRLE